MPFFHWNLHQSLVETCDHQPSFQDSLLCDIPPLLVPSPVTPCWAPPSYTSGSELGVGTFFLCFSKIIPFKNMERDSCTPIFCLWGLLSHRDTLIQSLMGKHGEGCSKLQFYCRTEWIPTVGGTLWRSIQFGIWVFKRNGIIMMQSPGPTAQQQNLGECTSVACSCNWFAVW